MPSVESDLRELGVAFWVHALLNEKDVDVEQMSGSEFYACAEGAISSDISPASALKLISHFDEKQLDIMRRSRETAIALVRTFDLSQKCKIEWTGCDPQKIDPIDVTIGSLKLSLKESSFILHNMGLYQYVTTMTGVKVDKALHIFEDFAPHEYQRWFHFCWVKLREFLNLRRFEYVKDQKYRSRMWKKSGTIFMEVRNAEAKCEARLPDSDDVTLNDFKEQTTSDIREHVFSKWIKQELQGRDDYEEIKKKCSLAAGKAFTEFITKHIKNDNVALLKFLRLCDCEYFLVKNSGEVEIFRVPSIATAAQALRVSEIRSSVPESQLNIITTIENSRTGKALTIRNELRFSHGQFNGTPEAKMYYGSPLEVVYDPVQIR